jgi:hypothetical protein
MTQQQRDSIALTKIEQYLDRQIHSQMECPECKAKYDIKDVPNSAVQMLRMRYDKLRATLSSSNLTVTQVSFVDHLDRIAALDTHSEPASNQTDAALH